MENRKSILVHAFALAATLTFLPVPSAEAGLIGDSVTAEVQFPLGTTQQGPASQTVGGGVEFDFGQVDIDVGDETIRFFNILGGTVGAAERYLLTDLDWVGGGGFTGFTSSFQNLSIAPIFGFTADSFWVTLQGGTFVGTGAEVNVRLTQAVPEPGVLALLSLGLVGLAATRRRRR